MLPVMQEKDRFTARLFGNYDTNNSGLLRSDYHRLDDASIQDASEHSRSPFDRPESPDISTLPDVAFLLLQGSREAQARTSVAKASELSSNSLGAFHDSQKIRADKVAHPIGMESEMEYSSCFTHGQSDGLEGVATSTVNRPVPYGSFDAERTSHPHRQSSLEMGFPQSRSKGLTGKSKPTLPSENSIKINLESELPEQRHDWTNNMDIVSSATGRSVGVQVINRTSTCTPERSTSLDSFSNGNANRVEIFNKISPEEASLSVSSSSTSLNSDDCSDGLNNGGSATGSRSLRRSKADTINARHRQGPVWFPVPDDDAQQVKRSSSLAVSPLRTPPQGFPRPVIRDDHPPKSLISNLDTPSESVWFSVPPNRKVKAGSPSEFGELPTFPSSETGSSVSNLSTPEIQMRPEAHMAIPNFLRMDSSIEISEYGRQEEESDADSEFDDDDDDIFNQSDLTSRVCNVEQGGRQSSAADRRRSFGERDPFTDDSTDEELRDPGLETTANLTMCRCVSPRSPKSDISWNDLNTTTSELDEMCCDVPSGQKTKTSPEDGPQVLRVSLVNRLNASSTVHQRIAPDEDPSTMDDFEFRIPRSGSMPSILSPKLEDDDDDDHEEEEEKEEDEVKDAVNTVEKKERDVLIIHLRQRPIPPPKPKLGQRSTSCQQTAPEINRPGYVEIHSPNSQRFPPTRMPVAVEPSKVTTNARVDISPILNRPTKPNRPIVLLDSPSSPLPNPLNSTNTLGKSVIFPRIIDNTFPVKVNSYKAIRPASLFGSFDDSCNQSPPPPEDKPEPINRPTNLLKPVSSDSPTPYNKNQPTTRESPHSGNTIYRRSSDCHDSKRNCFVFPDGVVFHTGNGDLSCTALGALTPTATHSRQSRTTNVTQSPNGSTQSGHHHFHPRKYSQPIEESVGGLPSSSRHLPTRGRPIQDTHVAALTAPQRATSLTLNMKRTTDGFKPLMRKSTNEVVDRNTKRGEEKEWVPTRAGSKTRFSTNLEIMEADEYDRRSGKSWAKLTPSDKAQIREELNQYKLIEMRVHDDSRKYTRFHR